MTEIKNNLFGIKWPTGVDMPLNKTQTQTQTFLICVHLNVGITMHLSIKKKTETHWQKVIHSHNSLINCHKIYKEGENWKNNFLLLGWVEHFAIF